jgi:hypothetical protein
MSSVNTQLNTAGTPIIVAEGGTGVNTMTTAYAPICAGTTATGTVQVASTGLSTSGFVLTSNGASSVPSFQAVSGALTTTSVALTVAQIQGAHASPVTLIAAQGANTVIAIASLTFVMVVAGTAYSLTSNSLIFGFGALASGIANTCAAMPISGSAFAGVTNATTIFNCSPMTGSVSGVTVNPICGSGAVNTALVFSSTSSAVTGGTSSGNSTVYITYFVVTV